MVTRSCGIAVAASLGASAAAAPTNGAVTDSNHTLTENPRTIARSWMKLLDPQTAGVKIADHHIYAVTYLDQIALVGEQHPIVLAVRERLRLPQLADVFQRRNR